jgi:hypothetical protein
MSCRSTLQRNLTAVGWSFIVSASWVAAPAQAADVSYYGVIKSIMYSQGAGGAPQMLSSNACGFNAFVVASTNGVLTNATVRLPSTAVRTLVPEATDAAYRYEQWFNSLQELEQVYPPGTFLKPESYVVTMGTTNDGVRSGSVSLSLVVPLSYPATPQLSNLTEAQSIDHTRDFALQWSSLGAGPLAIVQVTVFDAVSNLVFSTAAPFQPGALTGSDTSALIPANTLPPGQVLTGHLSLGSPGTPNTTSYSGATGVGVLGKDTQFTLATRPAPLPPMLTGRLTSGGQYEVLGTGETNRIYTLQSCVFGLPWANVNSTWSATGAFGFTNTTPNEIPGRLYRAVVGAGPVTGLGAWLSFRP